MNLYLAQHGEATSKSVNPDRPLTEKGHSDVKKMSEFLKQSDVQLGQIIHSGKKRAEQTAEYFVKLLNNSSTTQVNKNSNPNDSVQPLIEQIETWDSDSLIVGHLPYLPKLISYLAIGNDSLLNLSFQTGSIVCLQRTDDLNWQINWMLRPELLSD